MHLITQHLLGLNPGRGGGLWVLKAVEVKQHFLCRLLQAVIMAKGWKTFGARAPSCRCLMLQVALLEPAGLLVGWDWGRRSLQWRSAAPVLPMPPGCACTQPCSLAPYLVHGRVGKGRVKPLKPSQPGWAFAPVTCKSVAVTVKVHYPPGSCQGGGMTSVSHCES